MTDDDIICEVYRCSKRQEMYLYVDKAQGVGVLPQELLDGVGKLHAVMVLRLNKNRHLARADVRRVMDALRQHGFYLQMPPAEWPDATNA